VSTNAQLPVSAIRPPLKIPGARLAAAAALDPATVYTLPFVIALGYIFVDYGRPQDWIPPIGLIRPGMIALGSGVAILFARSAFPKDKLTQYMFAFLCLMAILVPFSFNRNRAFYGTQAFALLLFGGLMPMVAFVNTFPRLQHLMRFWVAVNVSSALYVITNGGTGVGSFLSDENDVALAMNMALPYAVALAVLERQLILKLIAVVSTVLILFASVETFSRGGFIGLAFMGMVIWLQSRRKLASMVVIGALVVAVVAVTPPKYWSDMASISKADQQGDTGFQRIYSWNVAWWIFLDNPVFGVGPNNYPFTAWRYETEVADEIGYHLYGRAAHSLYFTLLPEFGTAGTLIFFAMVVRGIRGRARLRRRTRLEMNDERLSEDARMHARWLRQLTSCIDASLAGFLASGAFLSVLFYPHVWVLTAFTAVLLRIGSESAPAESDVSPDIEAQAVTQNQRPAWWPAVTR
jgi:putative inorganic carbon (hco3(-)) transporter